jgi:hypothetical protein
MITTSTTELTTTTTAPALVSPDELFVLVLEERLELATLDIGHDKCSPAALLGE